MIKSTSASGVVARDDTSTMYPDALAFDDFRRRSEHAFVYETAPRRRALDFYMRMLEADDNGVDSLVKQCAHTNALVFSVAGLLKLGVPRKIALTAFVSVKKLRLLPCEEWHVVVTAVSRPDANRCAIPSEVRLRVKRAYVASVQASVSAVGVAVGTLRLTGGRDRDKPTFVHLLHTLAYAYYTLAAELVQHRTCVYVAARYVHRALALARCLYGPMSPRLFPMLNLWHDVNQAIGTRRDPQVAWWHSSIAADWFARIQARQSPTERGAETHVNFALWVAWGPARLLSHGRARIVERVHRCATRLWWQTAAAVWSRQTATDFDWIRLIVGRVLFYSERCDRRTLFLVSRLDAPLREAERARTTTLSQQHSVRERPLAEVAAPLELRIAQVRMIRGILRLRPSRRAVRSAVGDLRTSYDALWTLVCQPSGNTFENVCALAATTVALMEALHLLGAGRELVEIANYVWRLVSLIDRCRVAICDAWRVRVLARSYAAHWLVRVRDVVARRRADFRRYTASVNIAIDGARLIDPRVAVGSFIIRSFDATLAALGRTEPFVVSSQ